MAFTLISWDPAAFQHTAEALRPDTLSNGAPLRKRDSRALTGYGDVLARGAAAEDSVPPSARDALFTPCGGQGEVGLEPSLSCGTRHGPLNNGDSLRTGETEAAAGSVGPGSTPATCGQGGSPRTTHSGRETSRWPGPGRWQGLGAL